MRNEFRDWYIIQKWESHAGILLNYLDVARWTISTKRIVTVVIHDTVETFLGSSVSEGSSPDEETTERDCDKFYNRVDWLCVTKNMRDSDARHTGRAAKRIAAGFRVALFGLSVARRR